MTSTSFYNAHAAKNDTFSGIAMPIAILAVALRFVARARSHQQYGFEDWFAVLSLLFFVGYCALMIYGGHHGVGYFPPEIPYPLFVKALKISWAAEMLVPAGMMFIAILNVCWFLAATVSLILQCRPVAKAWDPLLPGKCFLFPPFMVGVEIPNSLLDFVIMALPIHMLRSLRISLKEKIVLALIFIMGGVVGVIGFIRIAIVYQPGTFNIITLGVWVGIQSLMAILCCCFPTYRPLLKYLTIPASIKSTYASLISGRNRSSRNRSEGTTNHSKSRGSSKTDQNYYLGNLGQEESILTRVEVGPRSEHKAYPLKMVNVEMTVEMV